MTVSSKLRKGLSSGDTGPNIADVFSTYLYDGGRSPAEPIINGIDLNGEGGLVWIKARNTPGYNPDHMLINTDTPNKRLSSNTTLSEGTITALTLNSDGFGLGDQDANFNGSTGEYVSWTFRKAPRFFDVVTYTGDGATGRDIPHNLGCDVGMVIVKSTNASSDWKVWHKDSEALTLNTTANGVNELLSGVSGQTMLASNGDSGNQIVGLTSGGFSGVISNDAGETWSTISMGVTGSSKQLLDFKYVNGAYYGYVKYMATNSTNYIYKSTDGTNWSSYGTTPNDLFASNPTNKTWGGSEIGTSIAAGPTNWVLCCGTGGHGATSKYAYSTNNGASFTEANLPINSNGSYGWTGCAYENGYYWIWDTYGTLVRSLTGTGNWTDLSANFPNSVGIQEYSDGYLVGGTNGGSFYYSQDNGSTWSYKSVNVSRATNIKKLNDKWFITGWGNPEFTSTTVAVSNSSDPSGSWTTYYGWGKEGAFAYASGTYTYMNAGMDVVKQSTDSTSWGGYWNAIGSTSNANFTVKNIINASNKDYIAYLFAHDPNGEDDDGMISCGSYSGSSSDTIVNLGWEPQFLLVKPATDVTANWAMVDMMRGMPLSGYSPYLSANISDAESTLSAPVFTANANGFTAHSGPGYITTHSAIGTYIYMAIRAPMMKEPESGSEVFAIDTGTMSDGVGYTSNFPVDMAIKTNTNGDNPRVMARLTGANYMQSSTTLVESSDGNITFDHQHGWSSYPYESSIWYSWMFKRAKGFFDVVGYTGNGGGSTIGHSLGVAPEMVIIKARNNSENWNATWVDFNSTLSNDRVYIFNSTSWWNGTLFSSYGAESLTASDNTVANPSKDYILYLFASLAGVSKVGSYLGNGSSLSVDCGFTNGARFVLIRAADKTGVQPDYGNFMWDSERGIEEGTEPYFRLDGVYPTQSDDSIDPLSSGFIVNQTSNTNVNNSGINYVFLAIA